jgi:hypothetical protein
MAEKYSLKMIQMKKLSIIEFEKTLKEREWIVGLFW